MKKRMPPLLRCVAWLLFAFLYAPILVVVVFSFNTARFGASWQGFTLDWYRKLFANEIALDALRHTLILAIASTLVATAIGSLLGYALRRFTFTGRRLMIQLLHIPVFVPDIVMAVSLLLLFKFLRQWMGIFELGLHTMALAHITFQIPFVAIVVRARLAGLDPVLEEAAHDLGGDARQVFRHVTLPLMLPGIFAGALLAFTLSLDDFVVSFFTSGAGSVTLPILIYSSVKRGITPEINALSTILIVLSAAATVTVTLLQRRERP